ncbi:MAG: caspase family protein [Candidatus Brocadiae bacterium]|nr:caspase family protein [Candidatus Brocadiia bacterium]
MKKTILVAVLYLFPLYAFCSSALVIIEEKIGTGDTEFCRGLLVEQLQEAGFEIIEAEQKSDLVAKACSGNKKAALDIAQANNARIVLVGKVKAYLLGGNPDFAKNVHSGQADISLSAYLSPEGTMIASAKSHGAFVNFSAEKAQQEAILAATKKILGKPSDASSLLKKLQPYLKSQPVPPTMLVHKNPEAQGNAPLVVLKQPEAGYYKTDAEEFRIIANFSNISHAEDVQFDVKTGHRGLIIAQSPKKRPSSVAEKDIVLSWPVKLLPGKNEFLITAKNRFGQISSMVVIERMASSSDNTIRSIASPSRGVRSHALLIGIDNYKHWPSLSNPKKDIQTIQEELQKNYGYTVETLFDVTKRDMLYAFRKLASRKDYQKEDHLLIMFSGHGYFDEITKTGYLVATESQKPQEDMIFSTFINYPELMQIVSSIPCRHILLVVDACFSGTLDQKLAFRGADDMYSDVAKGKFISRKLQFASRIYLTSGGKEFVPDGNPGHHSPFARRFLEALRSYGGNDRILSIEEVVESYMSKIEPEPRFGNFFGHEPGGSFLFFAKE